MQFHSPTFPARKKPYAVSSPRDYFVWVLDPKQERQHFVSIIQQRCTFY